LTFESNSVLIGVLLGYKQVAVYDLAKKIINMLLIPFSILNDAIYPNVVRSKNMVLMKKILVGVTYTALIIYVILQVFSSQIIELLAGKELMDAKILLAYLGCLIPLNAITYFLGNTVLVVMNKHKEFNVSVILSFFAYTLLSVILISLNIWNTVIAAIILTVSIIIQSSYRYYSVRKYKLL
jgi:PST family polysaccharide transporter